MAQELIREWQLAVMEVALDLSGRASNAVTTLRTFDGDSPRELWAQSIPLSEFGIGTHPPYSLSVPGDLIRAVERSMLDELHAEAALWIHLVPYYGLLGAVPWERDLIAATDVPVFRVPDRFPMPLVRGTVWSGAIAIDAGLNGAWAAPYVASLIEEWVSVIPARVEVDVFADATTEEALRRMTLAGTTRIHKAVEALDVSRTRTPRRNAAPGALRQLPPQIVGGSVWADWIADGLSGRAVRALHIVLDGGWDGAAPVLLVSSNPGKPTKRAVASMVGVVDLMQFVQSIGAATVSFGAPPGGFDEVAVRLFADKVGQQRSGATMFASIDGDPSGREVAAAEAFLVDPAGDVPAPHHPSLFAYAQPARLQPMMRQRWPDQLGDAVRKGAASIATLEAIGYQSDSTLSDLFHQAPSVPSWVASSDQFLGTQWAELAEVEDSGIDMADTRKAYDIGTKSALNQIQAIVERHARPLS